MTPFGNIGYSKTFNYNKRFSYSGSGLDQFLNELQFAYSFYEQLLSNYSGYSIEVMESETETTQSFYPTSTIQSDILLFLSDSGADDGFIVGLYDQKTGVKTSIMTASQQIQIVNDDAFISMTAKYLLEIPANTTLTISGIACTNRMKNLSMVNYIGFKGQKIIEGYSQDYVYPIKCSLGLMDFRIVNGTGVFWYDADGNISTAERPSPILVNAGNSYMFATNITANLVAITSNTTESKYTGNLKDIPRLTYYLSLYNCINITGDLSDLGGRITYFLYLYNCNKITGDLSDLLGKLTSTLNLGACALITGDLST